MDVKKRNIIIGIIVSAVVIIFGALACLGIFRGFNAQRFVMGVLDQTFKGEVEIIMEMTEGATEDAAYAQYESGIRNFVKNSLLGGVELDAELEEKYMTLCKKIFSEMKYSVQEAEKVSDDEFHVPVKYQPSNVLQLFIASVTSEAEHMWEKKEKGEYRGTEEEITTQMQAELLTNGYQMLEEAHKNMEYDEEVTIVLKVKKGENGLYKLSEDAITEFVKKILSLDVKED